MKLNEWHLKSHKSDIIFEKKCEAVLHRAYVTSVKMLYREQNVCSVSFRWSWGNFYFHLFIPVLKILPMKLSKS